MGPITHEIALALISANIREGTGVLSTQVLQKYTVNAIQILKQPIPAIMHQMRLLESFQVVTISPKLIRRALEISTIYLVSFWGSLIIAAAEYADCIQILTEDLNHGQAYGGLRCINPLKE
ncbi:hypothetical protein MASR2M78_14650 [Treponema sp.]